MFAEPKIAQPTRKCLAKKDSIKSELFNQYRDAMIGKNQSFINSFKKECEGLKIVPNGYSAAKK